MPWLQLSLIVHRDQAASVEAALEDAGALSVTLDDAADEPADAPLDPAAGGIWEPAPATQPLWRRLRITALFEDDDAGAAAARQAAEQLAGLALAPPTLASLDDRPWERLWLDDFRPTRFGRRLWVCPRGERPAGAEAADWPGVVVDLDPGLAFGTGHHPTTALCLAWLDGLDLAGKRVLDYGCGSGILAIAALKLGAASALAVDHDPQALDATVDNAIDNGVVDRLAVARPEQVPPTPADVVVANILAAPLLELAPQLAALAAPGARLGLSGILAHQAGRVADAYAHHFVMEPAETREEWALLSGRRR
ncbi:50S ribosomal protein L11 methyltransferase [uncultured Thiohalocapsa sp.]|uniref:50S ribosomal protein L11 methyltransferase n=1 Tax=uncultured Thiohalocapsa sp. TaxID=768990 RepID=UPI002600E54C|nr:50S ribosomal protein L11 methyltransferase [uncultured Thiohalocapsa sp.]